MSQTVSQRIPEIGLRMALGAQRNDVLRSRPGTCRRAHWHDGIATGIACCAWHDAGGMTALLYQTSSPVIPRRLAFVAVLLGVVALAACYLPARRAARVNPDHRAEV